MANGSANISNVFGFGGGTSPTFLAASAPIGTTGLITLIGTMTAAQAVAANVGLFIKDGAQYQVTNGKKFYIIGALLSSSSAGDTNEIVLGWADSSFSNGAAYSGLTNAAQQAVSSGNPAAGVYTFQAVVTSARVGVYCAQPAGVTLAGNKYPFWRTDAGNETQLILYGYEA